MSNSVSVQFQFSCKYSIAGVQFSGVAASVFERKKNSGFDSRFGLSSGWK